jgi:uncharacterized repeat protein (TIGR01451 family)
MSIKGRKLGLAVGAGVALVALWPASAVAQTADLSITKTDSADPVSVGSEFTYSLTVSNAGPDGATGVEVVDMLPNEVDFVSATPSQGTCELQGSKRVTCALGAIASGASASVEIRVRAARDGQAANTATVSGTPADSNQANNEDTEQTVVQEGPAATCAGQTANVVGNPGANTLTGTDQRDVIAAFGGNDTILGLDGRDIVCGGGGDDVIKGQGDGDRAKGGPGDDRIRGADGDDTLAGNGGNDNIGGGLGDDALRGGNGTDTCRGGPGRDTRRGCE